MELNPLWTVVIGPFIYKVMTYLKGGFEIDVPLLWYGVMILMNIVMVITANWLFGWGLDSTSMIPYVTFGVAGTELSHKTSKTAAKHILARDGGDA